MQSRYMNLILDRALGVQTGSTRLTNLAFSGLQVIKYYQNINPLHYSLCSAGLASSVEYIKVS